MFFVSHFCCYQRFFLRLGAPNFRRFYHLELLHENQQRRITEKIWSKIWTQHFFRWRQNQWNMFVVNVGTWHQIVFVKWSQTLPELLWCCQKTSTTLGRILLPWFLFGKKPNNLLSFGLSTGRPKDGEPSLWQLGEWLPSGARVFGCMGCQLHDRPLPQRRCQRVRRYPDQP